MSPGELIFSKALPTLIRPGFCTLKDLPSQEEKAFGNESKWRELPHSPKKWNRHPAWAFLRGTLSINQAVKRGVPRPENAALPLKGKIRGRN
jgi:hypothetical protein